MIYDKASLVHIPSGYKSGTLYNVLPNDADGDFNYSGGTNGTRVNKDGLIEEISADTPRLNYPLLNGVVQDNPTLLLEPQRINSTTYSQDFTQTSYWGNVIDVVATTNETVAPDGSNTGNKIQANSGTNFKILRTNAFTIPSGITMSMFVKRGNHDYILFKAQGDYNFNLNTLTWGGSYSNVGYELYPNDWVRLYATTSSSVLSYFGIYITDSSYTQSWNATGDEFVYVWGAQYETGSYPTSYIPTSGSAVTRTEDNCFINSGLQNILNTSEGTLFVDVEVPRVSTGSDYERIALTDQTSGTDRILIDDFGGNWRVVVISSAGTQEASIISTQANTRIKIAFTYSSSQIRVSYDGNNATTTSISYTPSTTLESFKFSNKDGNNKWQGKVYQAMYFDTALTNAELQTLTT